MRHAKKRKEEALLHLADFLDVFMWQADPETLTVIFVTKSVQELTGHSVSEWCGEPESWTRLIDPDDRDAVLECMRAVVADGRDREIECRIETPDGRTMWLRHAIRLVAARNGETELWGLASDITPDKIAEAEIRATSKRNEQLKERAEELRRHALRDPLTGLANRVLFQDRFETALRSSFRSKKPTAVLAMDLDRFKEINDTNGHEAGDAVLRQVALRLRIAMRAQDTPARVGGDEFAAVLPNTDAEGAERASKRILRALEPPIAHAGRTYDVGISIGIAVFPDHGQNAKELLSLADAAMYQAKGSGSGYALSSSGAVAPVSRLNRNRQRRRAAAMRRGMQMLIGIGALVALVTGAMVPLAQRGSVTNSTARLDAAAVVLAHAPEEEVESVIADVEDALADISLKDVGGSEVIVTLDRLERLLSGLSPYVSDGVGDRVQRLITTIHQAKVIAEVTGVSPPSTSGGGASRILDGHADAVSPPDGAGERGVQPTPPAVRVPSLP